MAGGVFIAFDDATLTASPTWTQLDNPAGYNLVQAWDITRGRNSELDRMTTGTATVRMVDRTGVLDPTNTTSPFYAAGATKLNPMKQAKIDLLNPATGTASTVFRGFVSEWLYDYDTTEKVSTVTLELADAFDLFAALELTPGQHGHTTGLSDFADVWYEGTPSNVPSVGPVAKHVDQRIVNVLDDVGWPGTGLTSSTLRDIFSGNVQLQGVVYARRDQALQALQDAADAEFPGVANVYISRDGKVRFRGRFARFNPTVPGYGIGSWNAGDQAAVNASGGSTAPLAGLGFRRSKLDIYNACMCLPQNIADTDVPAHLVKDTTSIGVYGWRGLSFNDLLVTAGHDDTGATTTANTETTKIATYYVNNYKDPKTRLATLTFRPLPASAFGGAALWALMCGVEIGDLIHVKTSHPGGGGFDEDGFIEGIRYTAAPMTTGQYEIGLELDVSPRSFYSSNPFGSVDSAVFWTLDSSLLDTTTKLI